MKLILRGKRFGFSLDEISAIIGMADNEVEETYQIEKSLVYAEKKIEDIQLRKKELILLEQDMISMKEKLVSRLTELKKKK
jgi:DNA-binding transcriptional MerR regulator